MGGPQPQRDSVSTIAPDVHHELKDDHFSPVSINYILEGQSLREWIKAVYELINLQVGVV